MLLSSGLYLVFTLKTLDESSFQNKNKKKNNKKKRKTKRRKEEEEEKEDHFQSLWQRFQSKKKKTVSGNVWFTRLTPLFIHKFCPDVIHCLCCDPHFWCLVDALWRSVLFLGLLSSLAWLLGYIYLSIFHLAWLIVGTVESFLFYLFIYWFVLLPFILPSSILFLCVWPVRSDMVGRAPLRAGGYAGMPIDFDVMLIFMF